MIKNILITGGAGYIGSHVAEILLKKHRNGETGKFKLAWRGQYTRFDNYVPDPLAVDNTVVGNPSSWEV